MDPRHQLMCQSCTQGFNMSYTNNGHKSSHFLQSRNFPFLSLLFTKNNNNNNGYSIKSTEIHKSDQEGNCLHLPSVLY